MKPLKRPSIKFPKRRSKAQQPQIQGPVTNDNVSRHREEVLSRARKFKYPFYRSKHRVALTSVSIVVVAVALLGIVSSWRLYVSKNTSEFTYRVTQILPFPVAEVDGSYAKYESYLFQLRHNLYWLEQYGTTDLRSPDGKRQIDYLKRLALDKALESAVASEFAKKNDISVSREEIDEIVDRVSTSGGDLESILREQYNLTEGEYRRLTRDEILKAKVAKALDKEAPKEAEKVLGEIVSGKDFAKLAKQYSDDEETKQLGGELGVIEKGKANLPAEVSEEIFKLKNGQVSKVIPTASDYYIVKMLEREGDTRAKVAIIKIKVKTMADYIAEFRSQGKVKEFINLQDVQTEAIN